jgi:hypothetical protein
MATGKTDLEHVPQRTAPSEDKAMSEEDSDFTTMADPEFLAERARVRAQLQYAPDNAATADLTALYQRLTDEFDRRASAAWRGSQ